MELKYFLIIPTIILTILLSLFDYRSYLIKNKRSKERYKKQYDRGGAVMLAFASLIMGYFLLFMLFNLLFAIFGEIKKQESIYVPIVSLQRDSEVSGTFILGCGRVKTTQYYYMYQRIGEDEYKLTERQCSLYSIKESNKVPGIYGIREKRILWNYLTLEDECFDNVIYVPRGTIIRRFEP